jgi:hypothetical protein
MTFPLDVKPFLHENKDPTAAFLKDGNKRADGGGVVFWAVVLRSRVSLGG